MIKNIIKIEPTIEYFSITWAITSRCNYDCMYCPEEFHDNSSKHYSPKELKLYWSDIVDKTKHLGLRYKISITGGEATTNKDFLPFLEWMRHDYTDSIGQILLTSNGSASVNYYKKAFSVIDNITLTVHSEHIDEKKFFDKVKILKKHADGLDKVLHVDIMDEYWNSARILLYKPILESNNIPYSINQLRYDRGTRTYPIFKGKLNLDHHTA